MSLPLQSPSIMKKKFLVLLLLVVVSSDSLQEQQPPSIPLRMKIKTLLTNAQSYIFPPNLGGVTKDEPTANVASETEGGAGDKVIEAVGKSLGEGKATVEETAKTAAQKLKETFSSHHEPLEDL